MQPGHAKFERETRGADVQSVMVFSAQDSRKFGSLHSHELCFKISAYVDIFFVIHRESILVQTADAL